MRELSCTVRLTVRLRTRRSRELLTGVISAALEHTTAREAISEAMGWYEPELVVLELRSVDSDSEAPEL